VTEQGAAAHRAGPLGSGWLGRPGARCLLAPLLTRGRGGPNRSVRTTPTAAMTNNHRTRGTRADEGESERVHRVMCPRVAVAVRLCSVSLILPGSIDASLRNTRVVRPSVTCVPCERHPPDRCPFTRCNWWSQSTRTTSPSSTRSSAWCAIHPDQPAQIAVVPGRAWSPVHSVRRCAGVAVRPRSGPYTSIRGRPPVDLIPVPGAGHCWAAISPPSTVVPRSLRSGSEGARGQVGDAFEPHPYGPTNE